MCQITCSGKQAEKFNNPFLGERKVSIELWAVLVQRSDSLPSLTPTKIVFLHWRPVSFTRNLKLKLVINGKSRRREASDSKKTQLLVMCRGLAFGPLMTSRLHTLSTDGE
jgi:hypothetical protein